MRRFVILKATKMLGCIIIGMTTHCDILLGQTPQVLPALYSRSDSAVNHIRTWDAVKPETNSANITTSATPDKFKMATQYFDGLGRPIQTVVKQGSMITSGTAVDMVSTKLYDEFGREQFTYLPSPANSNGGNTHISDGLFKLNPFQQQAAFYNNTNPDNPIKGQDETFFYGQTVYEPSPLNRVIETFAPGNSWVGTSGLTDENDRKSIKAKYYINTAIDAVRIWKVTNNATIGNWGSYSSPGAYPAGELYKNVTVDEAGHQVIEFKDKEGQVILKKVQLTATADNGSGSGHTGWLCTYYIYDDLNQLRCVIQPRGVELISSNWLLTDATILAEQCFRYEYDQRQRMIVKKVPGAGDVNMVYDKRDRLVMTQDAKLKTTNQWLVTKYDALNRPVETGLWTNTSNAATHRNNAANLAGSLYEYPNTTGTYEILTATHYDDYTGLPSPLASYLNTWNSNFSATDNNNYPYPQMPSVSNATIGMATWTSTKVTGTSTYLYAVSYYDDKGRVIQVQSTNITGGVDVVTTQYGWQGLPLIIVQTHGRASQQPEALTTITKNTYDILGRLQKTEKKQSHNLVNGGAMSAYKTISQLEYDALGQLKKKKLGTAPLETLAFDYNIRGWLLGTNRDYVKDVATTNYFGFDLGYDKNGVLGSFTKQQYNGNISGMIWKSKGDGEKRKYDFDYDAVNRILSADFNQYTSGSFNKTAGVDFSMANMSYDANGNILSMNQKGLKINTSPLIDQLAYTYQNNSNKLSKVIDAVVDKDSKLGDFKYDPATKGSTDYAYDTNGNLISDANKKITSITYNYLNLPSVITVTGKGTITYTYDATGNKLKKVTVDNTVAPSKTTTTLYLGGAVYENDVLQFVGHEEGRIRFKPAAGAVPASLVYDYFLKDHLGNVRMVLTEETKSDQYPPASMETAQAATEEAVYANLPQTRVSKPSGYPTDNYTNPNNYVAKTNGNGNKIGPSIILKVMAGDKFNIRVSSWYKKNGATPQSPNSIATDLVTGLINSLTGTGGPVHGAITSAQLTSSGVIPLSTTSFLNSQPAPGSTKPKAYINWILLDEQFKFVSTGSGAEQVGNDNTFTVHVKNDMPVTKNGYLYVFVSNETPNIDVYFDNLQVTHTRGPILEETHYYPFGLTMAGISSKALNGTPENKYKWNSGTEFNSTFDINLYETSFRSLDPQIGRFWQLDLMAEAFDDFSPYVFALNNPILFNDPNGLAPNDTLPEIKVMAKKPKELDTENGQVMESQSLFMSFLFGQREWNGYAVNDDGYLTGSRAIIALEVPDFGSKKSATRKVIKKVAIKYIVYKATKKVNGRLRLYIGKAKEGLKSRYTKKEIAEIEARVIEGLDNLPDNATALGVEQAIVNLNGGVNRIAQATSNIRNPTLNKIYRDVGEKWLNTNIPDWKEIFKY